MELQSRAYLALGVRTPIGRIGGALASVPPTDLAAALFALQLAKLGGDPPAVGRVILANATNLMGNGARVAALSAGLDASVSGTTINGQCSGGLAAVRSAAEAIAAGAESLVLAAGVESVSTAAVRLEARSYQRGNAPPRIAHTPDPELDPEMGPSADVLAERLGISREEQDSYAAESYRRTARARSEGIFDPVLHPIPRANGGQVAEDEMPRHQPDADHLARHKAAFGEDGTATAGNCAPIGDGAASVVVGSLDALTNAGVEPVARVVASASVGGDPAYPAQAVVPAIERALAKAEMTTAGVDRWEINEAFASKVVACIHRFGLDHARVNVNGGAIGYGHPFAASGAILVVHALAELQRSGVSTALAAIAGAGGIGEAMVLERWRA